jgi:uncharacterized protein YciI
MTLWTAVVGLGILAGQAAPPGAPSPAASPAAPDPTAYHAVLLKLGPKWNRQAAVRDQPGMREHGAYMSSLSSSGVLVLGGPFLEDPSRHTASGAIVFLATADAGEARRIMEADPGVKSGLLEIEDVRRFQAGAGAWRPWYRPAR